MATKNIKNVQPAPDKQLSCCYYDIRAKGPSDDVSNGTAPQSNSQNRIWDENFELLMQFKTKNGHCDVPRWHIEQGKSLGVWVRNQKTKKRKNMLEQRREDLLKQAGFEWNTRKAENR
mmetsp:Transcript_9215/g.13454  ORF Transcript_9215/g.13454 Transcript_9215/m.13454 type:complete len:118 (+) Transcript_9215:211-564(+)